LSFGSTPRWVGQVVSVWCRILPSRAVEGVGEAGGFGWQEVAIQIEKQLGTRPSAHGLNPLEVRPTGQVKTGEGVPQAVRTEVSVWTQRAADNAPEGARPKVVWIDEPPGSVWKDERLAAYDVWSRFAEDFCHAGREFDLAFAASLRSREGFPVREAAMDACDLGIEVHVNPEKRRCFAEPRSGMSQEGDEGMPLGFIPLCRLKQL
jgi:hypothetical protein